MLPEMLPNSFWEATLLFIFVINQCLATFQYISLHSAILVPNNSFIMLVKSYYSSIILVKFLTYYSQNYASIIGSGLVEFPTGQFWDLYFLVFLYLYEWLFGIRVCGKCKVGTSQSHHWITSISNTLW